MVVHGGSGYISLLFLQIGTTKKSWTAQWIVYEPGNLASFENKSEFLILIKH